MKSIKCHLADIRQREIVDAEIRIEQGKICAIERSEVPADAPYIMPGFIDAHIHIESTLLTPRNYATVAVSQGSVAAVCDPHEIANVLGEQGIEYMLDSAARTRFKFSFGVPSCVPSTDFETSGARLTADDVEQLMATGRFYGLAEMMNFPGVLTGDPSTMAKIHSALERGLVVDGHAPGLSREESQQYIAAGISTDHEMFDIDAARYNLSQGEKILIREGSAACNLDALMPLLDDDDNIGRLMLCSDDKYPDELMQGYINRMVARCVARGVNLWNVLYAACITPIEHYGLNVGTLRQGDPADFIEVDNLSEFNVLRTYIDGVCVYGGDNYVVVSDEIEPTVNNFNERYVSTSEFEISAATATQIRVIQASEGELYTRCGIHSPKKEQGSLVADPKRDILKIAVVNRYEPKAPAIAFVSGFGLKRGAIASTIAHDSHNIIAVGCSDREIALAVNILEQSHGGLCVVDGETFSHLPLPVAGLMSADSADNVARSHIELKRKAAEIGCRFKAPYMTLAFMALPVIPELKLTDRGLFDVTKFEFTDLCVL